MYNIHARGTVEQHLSSTQFAYRTREEGGGGGCIDVLLSMQHTVYCYLDDPKCKAVRLFAMDFSKASTALIVDFCVISLRMYR